MSKYRFLSKALIKVEEIKKEFNSDATLFGALNRLVKSGKIIKLKGGLYATVNPLTKDIFANRFEIATALHKDAYVSYHSALEYYGLATQVYSDVQVITSKRYMPIIIDDLEYHCYNVDYIEGIVEYKHNAIIRVTEIERTVIDCIDRIDLAGGLEEVFLALSVINYCDERKLIFHLKKNNKKILYKKVGYLFSLLKPTYLTEEFYLLCKNMMSKRIEDIRENKYVSFKLCKEWKLIVPSKIINMEN